MFAGSLLLASGAGTAVVVNGSFETGSFTDNTGQDTDNLSVGSTAISSWTVINQFLAWIGPTNPSRC